MPGSTVTTASGLRASISSLSAGPPTSASPRVRSGCTAANTMPTRPPSDWPARIALSTPTEVRNSRRSSAYSSAE